MNAAMLKSGYMSQGSESKAQTKSDDESCSWAHSVGGVKRESVSGSNNWSTAESAIESKSHFFC